MKSINQHELLNLNYRKLFATEPTKNYIDGTWVSSSVVNKNINPSDTSDIVASFYEATKEDVNSAIEAAVNIQDEWSKSSIALREKILNEIGDKLLANKDYYGEIISREAGKPLKEAIDEVVKSADFFFYFAAEAIRSRGTYMDSPRQNVDIEVIKEPIGVVALITPWNYPLAIPAWKIAPALAFGNSIVFKPSNTTPTIAYILAKIIDSTKLPKGVFNLVIGQGRVIGETITSSKHIDALSFTGSVGVGKSIARDSIKNMIKLQLEMGSKNSLIVLDDANVDEAVSAAIKGSYNATGQKCTSSSKLIVTQGIYEEFLAKMKKEMKKLVIGNSLDKDTQIGPVISKKQLKQNISYIELGKKEGATLVCGGEVLKRDTDGYFFSPALFTNGNSKMRLNQEEIFGPIACIIKVKDYKEALEVLNDTDFGLSGGIMTKDLTKAMDFKHNAKVGNIMINLPTAGMDNHVPFGGSKSSSFGSREKSYTASDFYTTTKTVYIKY